MRARALSSRLCSALHERFPLPLLHHRQQGQQRRTCCMSYKSERGIDVAEITNCLLSAGWFRRELLKTDIAVGQFSFSFRNRTPNRTANTVLISHTAATSASGACVLAQRTIQVACSKAAHKTAKNTPTETNATFVLKCVGSVFDRFAATHL